MKQKKFLPFLPAILLAFLGILIFLMPSYRFSSYICFGLAAVALCYGLLSIHKGKKHTKKLFWTLTALLAVGLLLFAITEILILDAARGQAEQPCAYLLVLGAGVRGSTPSMILQSRIDAAYDYLTAHPDTICIASGGQGPDEHLSEAQCIYDHLTAMGIDGSRIWLEDKATSTYENFQFSLDLIAEKTGERPAELAVLSSEFHLYRASLMARSFGITPVGVPAHTPWLSLQINYFLREAFGVWHYLLLGG